MNKLNLNKIKQFVNCKCKIIKEEKDFLVYRFYFGDNTEISVVKGYGTLGAEKDLFEMGFLFMDSPLSIQELGYLTEREVLNLLKAVELYGELWTYENSYKLAKNNSILYQV